MSAKYDIIVIGGGHAGIEAANAASKFGLHVAMITFDAGAIGRLSCNPAIGGIAKSHVVREVDCLGGLMGIVADETALQYRTLNRSKGRAVRATRTQNDRAEYASVIQTKLRQNNRIEIIEGEVAKLIIKGGKFRGVILANADIIESQAGIIASGTFLGGKIFIGKDVTTAGRAGEPPSNKLADCISSEGIAIKRFKTGTPPRIISSSVDFSKTTIQPGEDNYRPLSIHTKSSVPAPGQFCCHITRTNERTHEIIRNNLSLSPMFDGRIEGTGPRYCPSIEVKIVRFPDNPSHTIFLEPEGRKSHEIYVNGISMSLPRDVQKDVLRTISGLENCDVSQWAYAIEYDCIDSTQLKTTLELRGIAGLYFAGQVNGTSGYEEAAGQGVVAGINAALAIKGEPPFLLTRDESYISVMISDIISRGADEPYRLFSSRAESRLKLREDNAIWRMLPHSERLGLIPDKIIEHWRKLEEKCDDEIQRMQAERVPEALRGRISSPNKPTGFNYLKQAGNQFSDLVAAGYCEPDIPDEVVERIEIEAQYGGFISREEKRAQNYERIASRRIPDNIDFSIIDGLTREAVEKLDAMRPKSLGDAGRIPGITPAAVFAIYVFLSRKQNVSRETIT